MYHFSTKAKSSVLQKKEKCTKLENARSEHSFRFRPYDYRDVIVFEKLDFRDKVVWR